MLETQNKSTTDYTDFTDIWIRYDCMKSYPSVLFVLLSVIILFFVHVFYTILF